MQQYLRDQIDWPQAFPATEYSERRSRVRKVLAAKGVDAIYVTTPANLTYLTGYDMIWYHIRNLTGLLIRANSDKTVWFDGIGHTTIVSTTPEIQDVVYFQRESVSTLIRQLAKELAARGLAKARIALEPWGYSPHGKIMDELEGCLRETGADVVDESLLIERIRLVKSPLEISLIREAASMADRAMAAARETIASGVMETELAASIMRSMMQRGGGYPGIRSMIGSGPRAGTHHSPPTQRRIKNGDLVFIDFCGSLQRYHVNLNRTFSLGAADHRWIDLMRRSAGCMDAIVKEVKPGDPWSKVANVGDRYLDEMGLKKYVWWAGGYALGIGVPPDWVGSFFAAPREGVPDQPLQAGMVFNYENQFDVWENWPGGSGAAYIETVLVTESKLEVLSALPRDLVVV